MKTIEELARLYIEARRKKINAKAKRTFLLKECGAENAGNGGLACIRDKNLIETEWCNLCKKAEIHHKEYYRWSARASGLLRRLENRINKANAKAD